mmetsp:Transcript_34875/g.58304  ORF Transcript_34875/g.58304 Transcript_34875/m.58304 type:complete len:428 (-) Transcript_34875:834-2117(-)
MVLVGREQGVVRGAPQVAGRALHRDEALRLRGVRAVEAPEAVGEGQEGEALRRVGLGPAVVVVVQRLGGDVVCALPDRLLHGPLGLHPLAADEPRVLDVLGHEVEGGALIEEDVPVVPVDHVLVGHVLLRHEAQPALGDVLRVGVGVGPLHDHGDELALQLREGGPAPLGARLDGRRGPLQVLRAEQVRPAQVLRQERVEVLRRVPLLRDLAPEVVVDVDEQRDRLVLRHRGVERLQAGQHGRQRVVLVALVPPARRVVGHEPVAEGRGLPPEQHALRDGDVQLQRPHVVVQELVHEALGAGVAVLRRLLEHLVVPDQVVPGLTLVRLAHTRHRVVLARHVRVHFVPQLLQQRGDRACRLLGVPALRHRRDVAAVLKEHEQLLDIGTRWPFGQRSADQPYAREVKALPARGKRTVQAAIRGCCECRL